jgi:hypothetical protein
MDSLKLASIYSYPPARLGFCGRTIKKTNQLLLNYITDKDRSKAKIKKVLQSFEAAYPYLSLIAKANNIKDRFSEKVVEALWLGNRLLENIKFKDFQDMVYANFLKPGLLLESQARQRLGQLKNMAVLPHHSFHVLVFGSVTGLEFKAKMYDLCLIQSGKVIKVFNKKTPVYQGSCQLKVEYQPVYISRSQFQKANLTMKNIYWKKEFTASIKPGDIISFHWDLACQILSPAQEKNLKHYTGQNLKLKNILSKMA